MADGSITIDTEVDSNGIKIGVRRIASELRKELSEVQNVSAKSKIAIAKQIDSFEKLGVSIDKQKDTIAKLRAEIEALDNQPIKTTEFSQVEKDIDRANKKLLEMLNTRERYEEQGRHIPKSMTANINAQEAKLSQLEAMRDRLIASDGRYDEEATLQKQTELTQKLQYAQTQLNASTSQLNNSYKSIANSLQQAGVPANSLYNSTQQVKQLTDSVNKLGNKASVKGMKQVSDGVKEIGKSARKSNKALKTTWTVVKALIGVRGLYMLIRKLKTYIGEGFKNFAQYSTQFNSNMSSMKSELAQLKNALAVAFSPVANFIVPLISRLVAAINTAIEAVSRFFAIIGGRSTYTRAVKQNIDYAKSIDETKGSADSANKSLAQFDDLKVLDTSKGSGSGSGELTGANAFEDVPIGEISNLTKKLKELADIFKDMFKKGFFDALGDDFADKIKRIRKNLERIKQDMIDIFTDPRVEYSMMRWYKSFAYMLGTAAGAATRAAINIGVGLTEGIADFLDSRKEDIKQHLIEIFDIGTEINQLKADYFIALGEISDAFASNEFAGMVTELLNVVFDLVSGVQEVVLRFVRDFTQLFVTPVIENSDKIKQALQGMFDTFSRVLALIDTVVSDVSTSIKEFYDTYFKPVIDDWTQDLTVIERKLLDLYMNWIKPITDNIVGVLQEAWDEYLKPIFDDILISIGSIIEICGMINEAHEQMIKPIVEWLEEHLGAKRESILSAMRADFQFTVDLLLSAFKILFDRLRTDLQVIVDMMNGDWQSALQHAQQGALDIQDDLTKPWTNLVENARSSVNATKAADEELATSAEDAASRASASFGQIGTSVADASTQITANIKGMRTSIDTELAGIPTSFEEKVSVPLKERSATMWTDISTTSTEAINTNSQLVYDSLNLVGTESATQFSTSFTEQLNTSLTEMLPTTPALTYENWYSLLEAGPMTAYTTIWGEFMELWNTNSKTWQTKSLDVLFGLELWTKYGKNMQDGIYAGFKGIVVKVSNILNSLIDGFNKAIQNIVTSINALITSFNEASAAMGGPAVNPISAPPGIAHVTIPALAKGAVIPPNKEFMAILGDQKHGTNIEAPLDTIVDAMKIALNGMNFGSGNQSVNLTLDGEVLARLLLPYSMGEMNRVGYDVSVLEGGV